MTLAVPLVPAPDPFATCVRFSGLPYLLFLDSSAKGSLGRYSFVTADPVAVVRSGDPLEAARAMLRPHRRPPLPGVPPFQGGIAGYVGYDWGAEQERVKRPRNDRFTPEIPDVALGLYDWVIAWDHLEEQAWLVSTGIGETAGSPRNRDERATARLAWVQERLATPAHAVVEHAAGAPAPLSNFARAEYEAAVTRVRDYIAAGDVYQVNIAQRFHTPFAGSPLALYRRLRARNPAPFGAYLDFGGATALSISPERFLRLDATTRVAEARPIKGTRPRGTTAERDAVLARELAKSPKDRAENVMIVDLLRNDLGRVCRTGSVNVDKLFALESHPTVHHLVSTVTGVLRDGADAFDLLRAAFPGGSVTGAPKIRAMEIIAELERAPRGVYCGAIGYISATGAMDLNIPIRTVVLKDGQATFHAGAGIVWDSDPAAEYQETLAKAATIIEALTSPRKTPRTRGRAHPPA